MDLVATILKELPPDSNYIVSLRQKPAGELVQVDFCIGTRDMSLTNRGYVPLVQCTTSPEELPPEATINYQARWQRLCEVAQKEGFDDPITYLALTEMLDYSVKLPTGMHIVSGAMKYTQAFDSVLGEGKVAYVGLRDGHPRSRNHVNIAEFRSISNSFFSGFETGDIPPDMRTTQH